MIYLKVSAVAYFTEDPEKVRKAISTLFSDIKIENKVIETTEFHTGNSPSYLLVGEGGLELLRTFHGLIRREKIIDTIRDKAFSKGLSSDGLSVRFLLNKQSASVGIPSIPAQEEPLGSIEVFIRTNSQTEMERLFEWLLPPTENGKPLTEIEMKAVETA